MKKGDKRTVPLSPHTVLRYMTPSAYEAAYYERLEKRANNESNTTGS